MEAENHNSKSKEEKYYQQLVDSRNFDLQKTQAKEVVHNERARTQSLENSHLTREEREKAELKRFAKNVLTNPIKTTVSAGTAFTAIQPGKDAMQFLIIIISIIADIFGLISLIPFVGTVAGLTISFFFSIAIWVLYAMSGHFRKFWVKKVVVIGGTQLFEIFFTGLNVLPVFTLSALLNYWFTLTERKMATHEERQG